MIDEYCSHFVHADSHSDVVDWGIWGQELCFDCWVFNPEVLHDVIALLCRVCGHEQVVDPNADLPFCVVLGEDTYIVV